MSNFGERLNDYEGGPLTYGHYIAEDGKMSDAAKTHVQAGITALANAVSRTAHSHGWWSDDDGNDKERNMGEMIALMHSELSEALEAYRNSEPPLWYRYNELYTAQHETRSQITVQGTQLHEEPTTHYGKPEGLASEFADTIIRILDTCQTLEIPIVQALLDKAEYNRSRPYRHGGKVC